jgi:hypothetical protein
MRGSSELNWDDRGSPFSSAHGLDPVASRLRMLVVIGNQHCRVAGRGNVPVAALGALERPIAKGLCVVITLRCPRGRMFNTYHYQITGRVEEKRGTSGGEYNLTNRIPTTKSFEFGVE